MKMSEDEARRLSRYGKELQHMATQADQVDPIDNSIVGNEKQEGSDALRRPFSGEPDEERHKRRQAEIAAWKPPSTQPAPQPYPRPIGWPFGTILWWTGKE